MLITKRIKLGTIDYYIKYDCIYKTEDGITQLCLKDYKDDYYDGGDLSELIKQLEDKYDYDLIKRKYDCFAGFLNDCLYIYEHIPFISGIGDMYVSSKDNVLTSISCITKEELDDFIKENKIELKYNKDFKLWDGRTWNI